jgi:hypothetical protein
MTNVPFTRNLDSGLGKMITASINAELTTEDLRFSVLCALKEAGFEKAEHCSPFHAENNPEGCTPAERKWLIDHIAKGLPAGAQEILALGKEGMQYVTKTPTQKKTEPTTGNWDYWNRQPASRLGKISKQLDQVIWSKKIPVHDVEGKEVEGEFQEGWAYSKDVVDGTGGQAKTPKSPKTKILEALAKVVAQCEKDEAPDYDAAKVKKAINAVIKSL